MKSREIRLTRNFTGPVKPEYFELAEVELPDPADGEVRVKNAWLSVDPYMRGRVTGINMLYTELVQDAGGTLRVPNNLLFQRAIRTVEGDDTASLGSSLFHHD